MLATTLLLLGACSATPQEELVDRTPRNVSMKPATPAPAAVKEIPDLDDKWAKRDPIAKRFENMSFKADGASARFQRYISKTLEARGFNVDLSTLAAANAQTDGEWWDQAIDKPLRPGRTTLELKLEDVVATAAAESAQVKSFGVLPAIRQTAVREAEGRFTPEVFGEARAQTGNDPATAPGLVRNSDRLRRDDGTLEFGLRGRLRTGAEVTLAQRFGYVDTNSTDFDPGEQSESRTSLTLIQPLLRGSGLTHNAAPTRIARLDTEISQYELVRQLENFLLEVERAYWNLYSTRAEYFLMQQLAGHGTRLASQASARADIDADPALIIRAEAARDRWQANVIRAETAVSNAQYRLAALTSAPEMRASDAEFITISPPNAVSPTIGRDAVLLEVLERRPELRQAFLQYEAATLREGVAANEDLPELDLVLEGTLSGNADDDRFADAANDSEAGGLVGLRFSIPLGYDERAARYERRRLETIQQRHQAQSAISTILLEVEVSANEYAVAARDLSEQRRAHVAAQRELDAVRAQWEDGAGFATRGLALSELLNAYERINERERSVAVARATLAVSAANFNRSRGVLLDRWGVEVGPARGVRGETVYRVNSIRSGR